MNELVSIVVPMYNEAGNVQALAKEITSVMDATDHPYEVLLVNDGSADATWGRIQAFARQHSCVKGIDLAGNYGQTIALRAGIKEAQGEIIVAMDGDMQHDPKYIPEFLEHIQAGYDMVGGSKQKRPDSRLTIALANMAHSIICRICGVKMKYFGGTFKAYRSYLLKNINMLGDAHRYLGALVARRGVRFIELPIEIRERGSGKSSYSINKVVLVIIDMIFLKFLVSFMNKPFRLFGVLGGAIACLGLLLTAYFGMGSLFFDMHVKEQYMAEFLFAIFLMLVGVIIISIGLIAEIGIFNYYSQGHSPYNIRQTTPPDE